MSGENGTPKNDGEDTVALVPIDNLDEFVAFLFAWHQEQIALLNHMQQIPEGVKVQLGAEPEVALAGDLHKGFKIGLMVALSKLGTLPFVPEFTEDDAPTKIH